MTGAATATMLDAALDYARSGWPVFPCHTPTRGGCSCKDGEKCKDIGKHPRILDWPNQATTDPATIRQWWTRCPHANIGIATGQASGFFVLDVDPRHGGDETLRDLEAQHGELPPTVETLTGGGGRHIFFRYPGYPVKTSAGALGHGLDIRGDGGLIVTPPSLHASGRRYEWEASSHPEDVAIAEAPAWLLTMLTAESNGTRTAFTIPEAIREGERNATLYKLARSMKAKGLSGEAILAALQAENRAKCQPPLPDVEIESIALHATEQADRPEFAANSNGADRQASALAPEPSWPTLAPEALHGAAGEIVAAIDPHTEADRVAVLAQFLTMFGCVLGRELHFRVEWTRHPAKHFTVLVGDTSKGRKGTSTSTLKRIFEQVDPDFAGKRLKGGLSSGEGLIWNVRDPVYGPQKNRETGEVEEVMTDPGEADKRLAIVEPEFAQALKVMGREGNTLSTVIRQAFDDEPLTPLTKNNRITATGSHIAVIGHITKAELLRHLSETEMANGFCNRFIFLVVRRSKCLPNPKGLSGEQIDLVARRLRDRIEQAHKTAEAGPLQRDDEAEQLWAEVYPSLSDGKPGLTGAILGRGEVHVMRLALTYALLDGARCIQTPHLLAALALWEYAEASVKYIFGEATGDAVADRILEALKNQGPMTETEISDLFQRNVKAGRIHRALETLQRSRLIEGVIEETGGRKKTVWRATKKTK